MLKYIKNQSTAQGEGAVIGYIGGVFKVNVDKYPILTELGVN
jgi:hypothetical protein